MKTYAIVIAGFFLVSIPAEGQSQKQGEIITFSYLGTNTSYTTAYLKQAASNYEMALKSWNDGVVEAAIAQSTYLYVLAPQINLRNIREAILNLAESGHTPAIRYKAYLASIVFDSPLSFESVLSGQYTDSDEFFAKIASQVHKDLLGHNIK